QTDSAESGWARRTRSAEGPQQVAARYVTRQEDEDNRTSEFHAHVRLLQHLQSSELRRSHSKSGGQGEFRRHHHATGSEPEWFSSGADVLQAKGDPSRRPDSVLI